MNRHDRRARSGERAKSRDPSARVGRGHDLEAGRADAAARQEGGEQLEIDWLEFLEVDGVPHGAIVTGIDRAQVGFEVGDEVAFAGPRGSTHLGTIEKLNPMRARVLRGGEQWAVPYEMLRLRNAAPGREGREERLVAVAKEARALMDAHGLEGWTFRFSAAERRLGACLGRAKIIELSRRHAVRGAPGEVRDTILHEIAHALAGAKARHGPAWKAIAARIGATPKARAEEGDEARERSQAVRARFGVGMEVCFTGRGGRSHRGVIVKMNPRRARVQCGGEVFLVPYALLGPAEPKS